MHHTPKKPGGLRSMQTDPDESALKQLRDVGSDLTRPHAIDFYLYFSTQENAKAAQNELVALGFSALVRPGALGNDWLCLATRELVPTHEHFALVRAYLIAIADRLDGEYDGWEAKVIR